MIGNGLFYPRQAVGTSRSLLGSYSARLGQLAEQRMSEAALLAAKEEAERQAERARQATSEAEQANESLRAELERRLQVQFRLEYLATHDPLTALPNRTLFHDRMVHEMKVARAGGCRLALMYIDLDHFKDINDTLGHAVGDGLLKEVAQRLAACLSGGETVARLGGDEFAVLQAGVADGDRARQLAERLIAALNQPFSVAGRQIFTSASVGITLFPDDGDDPDLLHRNADLAMYRAKQGGRNGYDFFDRTLNQQVHRRAFLEQGLYKALSRSQLSIAYQPQVEVATGLITGVEALLRWSHPEFGDVSPVEFIPVAERSGLIGDIGTWVLRESCQQAMRWKATGIAPLTMAVNVAVAQLVGGDVPRLVADVLQETGLPAGELELEITESGVMNDLHNAQQILSALRSLGVHLAIDDFGTGYSSLSYLRTLPVDRIKIDRSFVTDVIHSEDAAAIATTIVTLARNLRLEVIAEGVETAAHAQFVRAIACGSAQGFYYGRPASADELGVALSKVPRVLGGEA